MSPNTARKAVDKCGIWSASGEPEPSRCHQSNKMNDHQHDDNMSQIEELILCGHCKRPFNDANLLPKDLACKHTFCLECVHSGFGKTTLGALARLSEVYCPIEHCFKLTELTEKEGSQALDTNAPRLALVKLYMKWKGDTPLTNGDISMPDALHEQNPFELCASHHGSPMRLWCIDCRKLICNDCQRTMHSDPARHRIWTSELAGELLKTEAYETIRHVLEVDDYVRQLARRQRQFMILIRDACNSLIREVQATLDSEWNCDPSAEIRAELTSVQLGLMKAKSPLELQSAISLIHQKKEALEGICQEMATLCKLNDLIGNSENIFNFETLQQAVTRVLSNDSGMKSIPLVQPHQDPILFLTNYCMSQLFSRLRRTSSDSSLLNHILQRQLEVPLHDITVNSIPSPVPSQPNIPPLNDPREPFPNEPNPLQVQLEQLSLFQQSVSVPVPVPLNNHSDAEQSCPATPPDNSPSPPPTPPQANPSKVPPVPIVTTAQIVQMQPSVVAGKEESSAPIIHPPVRPVPIKSPANVSPRYYFHISINGVPKGQIIIETRPDVAPKMCRNFDRLTTMDRKASYKGCAFFQCWKDESVITGDYEFNTGRGGKSVYEEGYFQPDETRLPAVRGAVGMRRQQKKHDYNGYVGSQFRIILQDISFTGIFGHVVEGIELVETIASFGDQTGKPVRQIVITRCGKLDNK